ncbi:MAG TPA: energy transducer TonB, partial [Prolixibacteraceae bacterium]|nr:energy transducer TonB [Prolixibacteraceae bacterium]
MELKKSEKADLENKKNVFLLIGLVAALGITLLAFEWTTKPAELASLGTLDASAVEEEVIPITRQEEMKTPPPPPPQTVVEVLNIVDNNAQVNDDLSIFDSEADNETFVDVAPIVQAKEEKEEAEEAQVFFIVE